MNFLKTENFKSRITTAIALAIICGIAVFTPQLILFRVLFAFAGIMAILEIGIASYWRIQSGIITDDRIITLENIIIVVGSIGISCLLDAAEIALVVIASISNDIMAYFTGYFLGKHKLCPKLSPKKTVEGAVGGVIGSAVFCAVFALIAAPDKVMSCALAGLIASPFAQAGDLIASAFKRKMGIKDYGKLIPGHGGIMDRFDSVLLTAPFIYYVLLMVESA